MKAFPVIIGVYISFEHLKTIIMEPRINLYEKKDDVLRAFRSLNQFLARSPLEKNLLDLVLYRVSQINGCAYCLDMHSKDLRAEGESEQRLYLISAWREVTQYTPRERAALAWAEAVTQLQEGHVPDSVFEELRQVFSEDEIFDLTIAVITINSYNRLNVAFRTPAGDYQPGQYAVEA